VKPRHLPFDSSGLTVTLLTGAGDLDALRSEWERLLASSASASMFVTWEWMSSWWSSYGQGSDLRLYRVEGPDGLLGIAPLYRRSVQMLGPLRHKALFLVGDGSFDSDYLDWISLRGKEEQVVSAVLAQLAADSSEWDLLVWNEVPAVSPHLPWFERYAKTHAWHWSASRVPCARVQLPSTWDEYVKQLKPRMRTKVRSVMRELERFDSRYDMCAAATDLPERLSSLYELHNQRWATQGKSGVFVAPEKRAFYELLAPRLLERGWLRFYSLRAGGRYVAHQFCFEKGNVMYLLQEALDPTWFEHGAGNALRAYVLRDCINRNLEVYDFLGGVTPHKMSWGATVHHSVRTMWGPRSFRNDLLFGAQRARAIAKQLLRPEPATEAV